MTLPSPDSGSRGGSRGGRRGGRPPRSGGAGSGVRQESVVDMLLAGPKPGPKPGEATGSATDRLLGLLPAAVEEADYLPKVDTSVDTQAEALGVGYALAAGPDREAMEADQEQRDRVLRELSINASVQGPVEVGHIGGPGVGETRRLTREEYLELSPMQRAAVDFNAQLVGAVRRDLRNQEKYQTTASEQERERYDGAVEDMFGEDRGSDVFAPETLSVLEQLEFSDPAADLDDFLGLNVAITTKDLRGLGEPDRGPAPNEIDLDRELLQQQLVLSTERLAPALAESGRMIQNFRASARLDRTTDVERFGGMAQEVRRAMGYGSNEVDSFFETALTTLAEKSLDEQSRREGLAAIGSTLVNEYQVDPRLFARYLNTATRNSRDYGAPLGTAVGDQYHSAEEMRDFLGLAR